jgi:hypothetical protein
MSPRLASISTSTKRLLTLASAVAIATAVTVLAQGPQIKIQERHVSGQTVAPVFEEGRRSIRTDRPSP